MDQTTHLLLAVPTMIFLVQQEQAALVVVVEPAQEAMVLVITAGLESKTFG
jgi:hypothetical protein